MKKTMKIITILICMVVLAASLVACSKPNEQAPISNTDDNIEDSEIDKGDIEDKQTADEESDMEENLASSVWEGVSGNFTREGSDQYNNAILQMEYTENGFVEFEFQIMQGSESENEVNEMVFADLMIVGEDGIGRYETGPDAAIPLYIGFVISENGEYISVDYKGEFEISPSGSYHLAE